MLDRKDVIQAGDKDDLPPLIPVSKARKAGMEIGVEEDLSSSLVLPGRDVQEALEGKAVDWMEHVPDAQYAGKSRGR